MKTKIKYRVVKERMSRRTYNVTEHFIEVKGDMVLARREVVEERVLGIDIWPDLKTAEDVCVRLKLPRGAF